MDQAGLHGLSVTSGRVRALADALKSGGQGPGRTADLPLSGGYAGPGKSTSAACAASWECGGHLGRAQSTAEATERLLPHSASFVCVSDLGELVVQFGAPKSAGRLLIIAA